MLEDVRFDLCGLCGLCGLRMMMTDACGVGDSREWCVKKSQPTFIHQASSFNNFTASLLKLLHPSTVYSPSCELNKGTMFYIFQ
jgi:hypothetical protein